MTWHERADVNLRGSSNNESPARKGTFAMRESERRKQLGGWGEEKALDLLKRSGSVFKNAKDVNEQTHNHPFGDILSELRSERFLIGVKTRNMYQVSGELNCDYNIRKKMR
jgi:hypothetical protein